MSAKTETRKSPLRREAEAAKAGAKAGAKARRREREEGDAQTAAILAAERGDWRAATWTRTYTAGTDPETGDRIIRTETIREDARHRLTPAELLSEARRAARLAAGRLERRHGIPELQPGEVADLAAELAARILEDHGGELPPREKITREYLTQRAAGFVLDDPERANRDAAADGEVSLAEIAEVAEARARDRRAAPDPMLNPGTDGEWPELAAAADLMAVHQGKGRAPSGSTPQAARRAVSYLVCGGSLTAEPIDLPAVWGVSPVSANSKIVPRGCDWLRQSTNCYSYGAAILAARQADRDALDRWADLRAAIERGLMEAPRPPRAVREHRPRLEPDYPAPVKRRTDRRIIRTAKRRAAEAKRRGWTGPIS
jgi:hypothetical protein